ncbi:MAG: prolyl oligopeptidase family serine peptidase [Planctomycetes bacterium]|nr:prolyl oligopeptidase family serine peptidase [Planctomycetota bacterium]
MTPLSPSRTPRARLLRVLGIASLLSCAAAPAAADGRKGKDPGLVSEGGLKYVLHEPEKKSPRAAPLMVMLHGTGGGSEYFRTWIAGCRKRGYIVAVPESSGCGTPASGNTSGDTLKRWDAVDIPNVLGLVRELMNRHNVDRTRVAIMGFSNGAFYAARIGLGNPDLFQSVVCLAGGIGGRGWTDASRTMGVYVIHGTADTSVPVQQGRSLANDLKADGFKDVILKEFPGRGHETFPEESEAVLKWLDGQRKTFTPGANVTLAWEEAGAGRKQLLYLYSTADGNSDLAVNLEWGLFADPQVVEAAKSFCCVKADREGHPEVSKLFPGKGAAVVLLDAAGKTLERFDRSIPPAEFAARLKKHAAR